MQSRTRVTLLHTPPNDHCIPHQSVTCSTEHAASHLTGIAAVSLCGMSELPNDRSSAASCNRVFLYYGFPDCSCSPHLKLHKQRLQQQKQQMPALHRQLQQALDCLTEVDGSSGKSLIFRRRDFLFPQQNGKLYPRNSGHSWCASKALTCGKSDIRSVCRSVLRPTW